MRVLVTGSAGFIGRSVCKALLADGHDVIPLDILLGHDITKPLPSMGPLDAVVHLAAMANPRECDANPAKAFDVNVNGTLQVLKLALAAGAKKVVFSSSAHVYGVGPRYLPTDEGHPLSLGNTYTTTKILGEELCNLYHENHGLSCTTLRLYNAYGPGQGLGYFVPDMVAKAAKGSIDLTGANVTKDWVYVDDVAEAFALAVKTPFVGALNIGTGIESNLGVVASVIAVETGAYLHAEPVDRPSRMQADIGRARRVLGWMPRIELREGIRAVCAAQEIAVR